ncbi:hypothetical protein Bhyg_04847, partial [Pseudolycoriella hygida]
MSIPELRDRIFRYLPLESIKAYLDKLLLVDTTHDSIDAVRKRVMSIPELRDRIFRYLPLESIKACRFVCHEWNATAGPLLIATSRIRFRNNCIKPDETRTPDKFIEEFQTGELLDKCNKFCFNSKDNWIEYDDLLRFIERFGDTMKELKIYRTYVRPSNALDQTDWIGLDQTDSATVDKIGNRSGFL